MAEAEFKSERLRRLSERAAETRLALSVAGRHLRSSTNLGQRMQTSIRGNLMTWISSAAVVGWVLARLPSRKKKIYIDKATNTVTTAGAAKGGLLLAVLGIVFKVASPFLQKMLVEQMGVLAEKHFVKRPKNRV